MKKYSKYLLLLLIPLLVFTAGWAQPKGRQLPFIGQANGLDTANMSGVFRATRGLIVRDTFTNKSGDFMQMWRTDSVKLMNYDSLARLFVPELMIGTFNRAGYLLDVPSGNVRFGGRVDATNFANPSQSNAMVLRCTGMSNGSVVIGGGNLKLSGWGVRNTIVANANVFDNFTGTNNAIFARLGSNLTNANYNLFLGAVGPGLTTVRNNIIIATGDGSGFTNDSNRIIIAASVRLNDASLFRRNSSFMGGGNTSAEYIQDFFFGHMPFSPDAAFYPVHLKATGGNGTNVGGSALRLDAGAGTGNAASGNVELRTSTIGSSGSTVQTHAARLTVKGATGIINISNTPSYADNAAAIAGGLVAGDIYRTGENLKIVY